MSSFSIDDLDSFKRVYKPVYAGLIECCMSDTAAGILSFLKILIHGPADILDVELPQRSRIRPLLRCNPLVCAGN